MIILPLAEDTDMIFRRQSTGSYMDYANGKPLHDHQLELSKGQIAPCLIQHKGWVEKTEHSKIENDKKLIQMQRKNSMTTSLRRSLSRSHSSDMSPLITIDTNIGEYTTPYQKSTTTMSTGETVRDKKKYSDQSLNSHSSDEYYDEEELKYVNDNISSEEEEENFFLNNSILDGKNSDTIDGSIFNLKKVPTHRFFSRLVEATSSFSNSTPSLPSMVKRSTTLNAARIQNQLSSKNHKNTDVKLQSARFYNLTDNESRFDDKKQFSSDNIGYLSDAFCDCWNEDEDSL